MLKIMHFLSQFVTFTVKAAAQDFQVTLCFFRKKNIIYYLVYIFLKSCNFSINILPI